MKWGGFSAPFYWNQREGRNENERKSADYVYAARLVRLASEKWDMSIQKVVSIFAEWAVLKFIREFFDTFHVEGDYVVLDDIVNYLSNRGVKIDT